MRRRRYGGVIRQYQKKRHLTLAERYRRYSGTRISIWRNTEFSNELRNSTNRTHWSNMARKLHVRANTAIECNGIHKLIHYTCSKKIYHPLQYLLKWGGINKFDLIYISIHGSPKYQSIATTRLVLRYREDIPRIINIYASQHLWDHVEILHALGFKAYDVGAIRRICSPEQLGDLAKLGYEITNKAHARALVRNPKTITVEWINKHEEILRQAFEEKLLTKSGLYHVGGSVNLDTFKKLISIGMEPSEGIMKSAVKNGNIEIVRYLNGTIPLTPAMIQSEFSYIFPQQRRRTYYFYRYTKKYIKYDQQLAEMFKLTRYQADIQLIVRCIHADLMSVVEQLIVMREAPFTNRRRLMSIAIRLANKNRLDLIQLLIRQKLTTIADLAQAGVPERLAYRMAYKPPETIVRLFQFLVTKMKCVISSGSYEHAISGIIRHKFSDPSIIGSLRTRPYPYDLTLAIDHGYLGGVKYMLETMKLPWNPRYYNRAIATNQSDVCKYFKDSGYQYDRDNLIKETMSVHQSWYRITPLNERKIMAIVKKYKLKPDYRNCDVAVKQNSIVLCKFFAQLGQYPSENTIAKCIENPSLIGDDGRFGGYHNHRDRSKMINWILSISKNNPVMKAIEWNKLDWTEARRCISYQSLKRIDALGVKITPARFPITLHSFTGEINIFTYLIKKKGYPLDQQTKSRIWMSTGKGLRALERVIKSDLIPASTDNYLEAISNPWLTANNAKSLARIWDIEFTDQIVNKLCGSSPYRTILPDCIARIKTVSAATMDKLRNLNLPAKMKLKKKDLNRIKVTK